MTAFGHDPVMMRQRILLVIAAALIALSAHAQFDPERAYKQSSEVRARYSDPAVRYDTPGFRTGRTDFTSHDEMLAFVAQLERDTRVVRVVTAGASREGRAIPALILSADRVRSGADAKRLNRPVVVIAGLQHGNEPAGGEAMLVLARELATGSLRPLLDRLTVVIVPHSNPDGAFYFRRSPYANTDINRDHVKVDLPETRALHRIVNEFEPHLFIDAHEFSVANRWIEKFGVLQSYDLMVQYATHPNVPGSLTALAQGPFLDAFRRATAQAGYTHFWYYTTSYNLKDLRVSMGGTTPDIGRNFAGLQNAVSFLIESRGVGIGRESFLRRVHSHIVSITGLLEAAAQRADELMATVAAARAETVRRGREPQPDDQMAVRVRSPWVKQPLDMIEPQTGALRTIEVEWSDSLQVTADLSRPRPWGYALLPPFRDVAERLRQSGIEVRQLTQPVELAVESYQVTDRRPSATYVEGRITSVVTTEVASKTVRLPAGSYVFTMAQPHAAVLTAALEPESPSSFVSFGLIPVDRKGSPATIAAPSEVPVYRLPRPATLTTQPMKPAAP